jgi:hypothetical protein
MLNQKSFFCLVYKKRNIQIKIRHSKVFHRVDFYSAVIYYVFFSNIMKIDLSGLISRNKFSHFVTISLNIISRLRTAISRNLCILIMAMSSA